MEAPADSLDGLFVPSSPSVPVAPRIARGIALSLDIPPIPMGRLLPSPVAAAPAPAPERRRILHATGPSRFRIKSACGTIFPVEGTDVNEARNDFIAFCVDKNVKYGIGGIEICPSTARPHVQFYFQFPNSVSSESIRGSDLWIKYRFHFEKANGSPMQNFTYCSKGEDFVEHGVRPTAGHLRGINYNFETLHEIAVEIARTPEVPRDTVHLLMFILNELRGEVEVLRSALSN